MPGSGPRRATSALPARIKFGCGKRSARLRTCAPVTQSSRSAAARAHCFPHSRRPSGEADESSASSRSRPARVLRASGRLLSAIAARFAWSEAGRRRSRTEPPMSASRRPSCVTCRRQSVRQRWRACYAWTRSGGRVVSANQDTETWVVDHPDRSLTRRLVQFYADQRFADGWTGRRLRSLFLHAGLIDVETRAARRGRYERLVVSVPDRDQSGACRRGGGLDQ